MKEAEREVSATAVAQVVASEETAADAVRVMSGVVAMVVEKWVATAVERTAQAEEGEPRGKKQDRAWCGSWAAG